MANLYEILGVSALANDNDIRTGYIKESVFSINELKYHPDRNAAPDATEKFQAVANAYYVLRSVTLIATKIEEQTTTKTTDWN